MEKGVGAFGQWTACWYCGLGSGCHEGHVPSQQTAEQFNSMAKKDMRHIDPDMGTHSAVVKAIEQACATWSAPLPEFEHATCEPKYTLNAADSYMAMSRPCRAPPIMLEGKSFTVNPPGQKQRSMPTIPTILEYMRKKNSRYFQEIRKGERQFIVMAAARPEAGLDESSLRGLVEKGKKRKEA